MNQENYAVKMLRCNLESLLGLCFVNTSDLTSKTVDAVSVFNGGGEWKDVTLAEAVTQIAAKHNGQSLNICVVDVQRAKQFGVGTNLGLCLRPLKNGDNPKQ
eukprot:g2900.t1